MLNDSTRKQYLTQNGYSRSFKVICFDVDEKSLGDYILRRNNFGLIYEISKDIATVISKKWQFWTTALPFDALYPANPHEYRHNLYILTN